MLLNQNIEYKNEWKDEYLALICGFANARGGMLYIRAEGKSPAEAMKDRVRKALGIGIRVKALEKNGESWLELTVPTCSVAVSWKGSYFYRGGEETIALTDTELERFLLNRRGKSWDDLTRLDFTQKDMDSGALARFQKSALLAGRMEARDLNAPEPELIRQLHLVSHDLLTNTAALLFAKRPDRLFPGAYIQLDLSEGENRHAEIRGGLQQQVDEAMALLRRTAGAAIPEGALREALVNAVCHRDYTADTPVRICADKGSLSIRNPAVLPEYWTAEELTMPHTSQPYNPNIANLFFLMGYLESWGSGIGEMLSACEKAGLPEPEITADGGSVQVKFFL